MMQSCECWWRCTLSTVLFELLHQCIELGHLGKEGTDFAHLGEEGTVFAHLGEEGTVFGHLGEEGTVFR